MKSYMYQELWAARYSFQEKNSWVNLFVQHKYTSTQGAEF